MFDSTPATAALPCPSHLQLDEAALPCQREAGHLGNHEYLFEWDDDGNEIRN